MNKRTTILLVIALLMTAGLGVYSEIQKAYAEEAEFMVQEQHQMLIEAKNKNTAIKQSAQKSSAAAKMAENNYYRVQKKLHECKTSK